MKKASGAGERPWVSVSTRDPLSPQRLSTRFELFEAVALPSLLAQTQQDFGWVIVIDPDLDSRSRDRLRDLVSPKKDVWLHEYAPPHRLGSIDWLEPYLNGAPDYLVTTLFADDDALPMSYVGACQEIAGDRPTPPAKIVGTTRMFQWDLLPSRAAPLGWKSPWHRKRAVVTGLGLSLLGRYPQCPINVGALSHVRATDYLDPKGFSTDPAVKAVRGIFARVFRDSGEQLESWPAAATFADVGALVGPALITNHRHNVQRDRLVERKPGAEIVRGADSFPGIAVDWGKVPACVRHAGLSPAEVWQRRTMLRARRRLSRIFGFQQA